MPAEQSRTEGRIDKAHIAKVIKKQKEQRGRRFIWSQRALGKKQTEKEKLHRRIGALENLSEGGNVEDFIEKKLRLRSKWDDIGQHLQVLKKRIERGQSAIKGQATDLTEDVSDLSESVDQDDAALYGPTMGLGHALNAYIESINQTASVFGALKEHLGGYTHETWASLPRESRNTSVDALAQLSSALDSSSANLPTLKETIASHNQTVSQKKDEVWAIDNTEDEVMRRNWLGRVKKQKAAAKAIDAHGRRDLKRSLDTATRDAEKASSDVLSRVDALSAELQGFINEIKSFRDTLAQAQVEVQEAQAALA